MHTMSNQTSILTDTISDNEVITKVLNGEKDFYALIVRRYNQRLYRIGMSMLKDDDEVEDVMQVAYIKAYENLCKFEFKAAFSTWLTRIFMNESLLRLRKRKQSVLINEEMIDNEIHKQPVKDSQTPLAKVLNQELRVVLEGAIRQLPEKYRTVFVMREVEGMNVAETQQCLDLTEVNVKVRLNRAKAMLRESLSMYYKNEEVFHFYLTRCDKMVDRVMMHVNSGTMSKTV